jgi:serine/threonine-protein phosphatase Stp1
MRFTCASRTHVGLKRKINEDSILVETARGLWVVADGMGGHDAGELASAMVVDALHRLPPAEGLDRLTQDAVEALRGVNRALIDLAQSEDRERTIGTTVVGIAIAGGWFSCFWAGDSRAYRMRDGTLARVSRDHSLVQQLVDSGMLSADEAEGHENANVITRAVGVAAEIVVDTVGGDALQGDQFLLASDGLTRVMDDDEIAAELERSAPESAADRLIEAVLARGAPDNVSLIIVKVG